MRLSLQHQGLAADAVSHWTRYLELAL